MTYTVQFEQITRKDCEIMGGNIPWRETRHRYLFGSKGRSGIIRKLDRNPNAPKPFWFWDYFQPPQRISIINGTPLLDHEGNPIGTVENPYPSGARVVRKGTPTPLIILIRREERRSRRTESLHVRRVVAKQQPTFNAVPEDILWHMHRRGKTLDNWSLQVLKSKNRHTLNSPRKEKANG